MQIGQQFSNILLVFLSLALVMSISCSKAEKGTKELVSAQEKVEEPSSHPDSDVEPEEIVSNEAVSNEAVSNEAVPPADQSQAQKKKPEVQTIDIPSTWKRLSKVHEIWIDKAAKEVIVAGEVCLNQGPLEMFICPQATKEHESVISANALSSEVHGALIFLGADPGKACSWDPEYRPAYGPTVEITLMWNDKELNKTVTKSAREWIRNVNTGKPLEHQWVFGGSEFWEDPDTHEQVYYGDSGEMVCLSNFSTATIDLNVESSQSTGGLLFEAFTENIPPLGTKVYAVIKPGKRIEPAKKADSKPVPDDPKPSVGADSPPGNDQNSDDSETRPLETGGSKKDASRDKSDDQKD